MMKSLFTTGLLPLWRRFRFTKPRIRSGARTRISTIAAIERLEDRCLLTPVLVVPDEILNDDLSAFFSYGWQDGESVDYEIKFSDNSIESLGSDTADYHGIANETHLFGSNDPLGTATITATGEYSGSVSTQVTVVNSHSGTYSDLDIVGPDIFVRGNLQYIYAEGWLPDEKVTYEITLPDNTVCSTYEYAYENGFTYTSLNLSSSTPEGVATLVLTGETSQQVLTHEFQVQHLPGSGPETITFPQYVVPDEEYAITGTRWADWARFYVIQGTNEWSEGLDLPDSHGRINDQITMDEDLVPWQFAVIEARDIGGNVLATAMTLVVDEIPTLSSYASGVISNVAILDVAATYDTTATELASQAPENGVIENQSLAQRTSWPIRPSDTVVRTGLTYYDEDRGVDVYAPENYFFIEYASGAIEAVPLPVYYPPGEHPAAHEVIASSRTGSIGGQVAKTVARTGLTYFDPVRGIDVEASSGNYFVEYVDGTVEERNLPTGGFVPRPIDFVSGGSDNSQSKSAYGPSLASLGLTESGGEPISSDELWLIGKEYVASNGQLRVAHDGNIFLQDPMTGIILERPQADESVALTKPAPTERTLHDSQTISDYFEDAYGRLPNPWELEYWMNRTDKSGAALLGAMETAYGNGVTVTIIPRAATPKAGSNPEDPLAKFDGQAITQYNPKTWTWDWVEDGAEQQVENFEDWLSSRAEEFTIVFDRLTFIPPAPVSQAGFDFYVNHPDYIVEQDAQTPEQVDAIHQGGVESWRIRRIGSISGAQVIFDANGDIIPPGEPGAGTPDLFSPTNVPLIVLHGGFEWAPWFFGKQVNSLVDMLKI